METAQGDARHAAAERGKGKAHPLDASRLVYWGQQAARAGDRSVARLLLTRALELDPSHEDAWLWRAGTAPQPDEALRDLEHLLQINPGHSRARLGLIAITEQLAAANGADPEPPSPPTQPLAERVSNHRRPIWRPRLVALTLAVAVSLLLPTHQPPSSEIWPNDAAFLAQAPDSSTEAIDVALLESDWLEDSQLAAWLAQPAAVRATHASPAQPAALTAAEVDHPQAAAPATLASLEAVSDLWFQDEAGQPDHTRSESLIAALPVGGNRAIASTEKPWVAVHRPTGLWSGPNTRARLFRTAEPGARLQVALPQNGPRLYIWDPTAENYAYVDAVDVGPAGPPWEKPKPSAGEKKPPVPAPVEPVQSEPSLIWPARGPITTYFGFVGPYSPRGHAGLDIAAPYGAPIVAAEAGQVSLSTTAGGPYGFEIIIDHASNLQTLYAHLSQLHVATGQTVPRGQLIGLVGSTGYSTGPHLHFEVRQGGALRDPLAFLP